MSNVGHVSSRNTWSLHMRCLTGVCFVQVAEQVYPMFEVKDEKEEDEEDWDL